MLPLPPIYLYPQSSWLTLLGWWFNQFSLWCEVIAAARTDGTACALDLTTSCELPICPGHTFKAPETHQSICGNDGKNENGLFYKALIMAAQAFLHHFHCFPPVLISSEHLLSNPSAGKLWMFCGCAWVRMGDKPKSHIPQRDYGINKCNYALHRCISLLSNEIKGFSMTSVM